MAKNLENTHFPIVYLRVKMILPFGQVLFFASLFLNFNVCFALVIGSRAELTLVEEEFYFISL